MFHCSSNALHVQVPAQSCSIAGSTASAKPMKGDSVPAPSLKQQFLAQCQTLRAGDAYPVRLGGGQPQASTGASSGICDGRRQWRMPYLSST
jgi:hypothetical protein